MATEKWTVPSAWTLCFSTSMDGLTSGNAVLSTLSVANATNSDIFADFSVNLASAAFATPNFLGVYLFPLNQDSSSFGNNGFVTAAAGPPPSQYYLNNVAFGSTGTQVQVGSISRFMLSPGTFRLVAYNQTGVNLAATGNTAYYRTYNRSIA